MAQGWEKFKSLCQMSLVHEQVHFSKEGMVLLPTDLVVLFEVSEGIMEVERDTDKNIEDTEDNEFLKSYAWSLLKAAIPKKHKFLVDQRSWFCHA